MGTPVKLYVYDLSCGLTKLLSPSLLGKEVEGLWHTAIVVYEKEYFFGSEGIKSCRVGGTTFGQPQEIIPLGETFVTYTLFNEYLQGLKEVSFTGASYNLLKHNCNHFTDEVAQFLCGVRIPKHILNLPEIIRETSVGSYLLQGIERLLTVSDITDSRRNSREDSPEFLQLNSAIEEIRRNSLALKEKRNELNERLAKKERKRKKKQRKEEKERQRIREIEKELEESGYQFRNLPPTNYSYGMAESNEGPQNGEALTEDLEISEVTRKARDVVAEIEAEERRELEELRNKQREPPITFRDACDVKEQYNALVGLVDGKLTAEEQQSLEELKQYMLMDEGSWALGDGFLNFVGRLLHDKSLSADIRTRLLNVMGCAALKDDVILLLHQDRRDHVLMNYAGDVERLTLEEQQALALFFVNLFENLSSSEWLLYISEWEHNNASLSNIRVTTKVGINALLSENSVLQERGSAIVHNMACKEVFDDVAIELTMALLQFLNTASTEELLFRALKSLARFCQISGQEVTQLIQMIGPEPGKFKGKSPRIDEQIELISSKLR